VKPAIRKNLSVSPKTDIFQAENSVKESGQNMNGTEEQNQLTE